MGEARVWDIEVEEDHSYVAGGLVHHNSMASPNLQQVPARHPVIGPAIRGLFLPEDGQLWASNDFSSQEPRILVHYASLLGLPGVETVLNSYREDPDTDFYQIVADAAGIDRKTAKTCIAEGQLVLTNKGLIPIEKITLEHSVWDGVEWVKHEGLSFMGTKEVITYGNLTATPDHDVWTIESGKIPFWHAASRLDALVSTGDAEQAIRYVDNNQQRDTTHRQASICQSAVRLWQRGLEALRQLKDWKVNHVPSLYYAQQAPESRASFGLIQGGWSFTEKSGINFPTMQQSFRQLLFELWRTGNQLRVCFGEGTCGIFDYPRARGDVGGQTDRSDRQRQGVHSREHTLRNSCPKQRQQANHSVCFLSWSKGLFGSLMASGKNRLPFLRFFSHLDNKTCAGRDSARFTANASKSRTSKVYDIINAGPRNRFTVSGVLVSNCSLGMMYGMGKAKLAVQLDLPVEEAGDLIKEFHTKVPFLRGTIDAVMRRIEHPASGGCIRTLLGRKCRFPLFEPVAWGINKALPYEQAVVEYGPRVKRAMTYKGLNRLIQGSAADQTKAAMLRLHKAGFNILLQVHDELALSVNNRAEAEEAAQLMCQAADLEVPSRVDVEIGPSWGEAV